MPGPIPTFAHAVHVKEDGYVEVYRIKFDLGADSYLRWKYYNNYGLKYEVTANDSPNTWLIHAGTNGVMDSVHLQISDAEFFHWVSEAEYQPYSPTAGGRGRRPQRVQKMITWREKQGRVEYAAPKDLMHLY